MHILNKYRDKLLSINTTYYASGEVIEYIMNELDYEEIFFDQIYRNEFYKDNIQLTGSPNDFKSPIKGNIVDILKLCIIEKLYKYYHNDKALLKYLILSIDYRISYGREKPLSVEAIMQYKDMYSYGYDDCYETPPEAFKKINELKDNKKVEYGDRRARLISALVLYIEFGVKFDLSISHLLSGSTLVDYVPHGLKYRKTFYLEKLDISISKIMMILLLRCENKELSELASSNSNDFIGFIHKNRYDSSHYEKFIRLQNEYYTNLKNNNDELLEEEKYGEYLKMITIKELTSEQVEQEILWDQTLESIRDATSVFKTHSFNLKTSKGIPKSGVLDFTHNDLSKFDSIKEFVGKYGAVYPIHTNNDKRHLEGTKKYRYDKKSYKKKL